MSIPARVLIGMLSLVVTSCASKPDAVPQAASPPLSREEAEILGRLRAHSANVTSQELKIRFDLETNQRLDALLLKVTRKLVEDGASDDAIEVAGRNLRTVIRELAERGNEKAGLSGNVLSVSFISFDEVLSTICPLYPFCE